MQQEGVQHKLQHSTVQRSIKIVEGVAVKESWAGFDLGYVMEF